jgi:hypothetical protein
MTTVFAALPAASLSLTRFSMAVDVTLPKPGPKRKVFFSPRPTIWSETPTSQR